MLGTDAAMEAGDIVLMDNNISKIKLAIKISKKTISIAYQNITLRISIKIFCNDFSSFWFGKYMACDFCWCGSNIFSDTKFKQEF